MLVLLELYFDDFGVVNPLAPNASEYKESAWYFTIGNLPYEIQCDAKSIQLLLLYFSKSEKKLGYDKILSYFLEDINRLSSVGMNITLFDGQPINIKCCVSILKADNLASHLASGLLIGKAYRPCRFCMINNIEMQSEFNVDNMVLRASTTHDHHCLLVEKSEDISGNVSYSKLFGIKDRSVLNKINDFHVIWRSPSDIWHDIYEGVIVKLLILTIEHCLKENYFDLKFVNDMIQNFEYKNSDKTDRPTLLKEGKKKFKVVCKQTASQSRCLSRTLPLMIGLEIPTEDKYWDLYIEFLTITELLLASSYNLGEILFLEQSIQFFLQKFKILYPNESITPKMHYMSHYGQQLREFGPLIHHGLMRYERKHQFMKKSIRNSKNAICILKSIANHHQSLMALHHENPNYYMKNMKYSIAVKNPELNLG